MPQDIRTGEVGHGVSDISAGYTDGHGNVEGWVGTAGLPKGEVSSQQSRRRNPVQPGCL